MKSVLKKNNLYLLFTEELKQNSPYNESLCNDFSNSNFILKIFTFQIHVFLHLYIAVKYPNFCAQLEFKTF